MSPPGPGLFPGPVSGTRDHGPPSCSEPGDPAVPGGEEGVGAGRAHAASPSTLASWRLPEAVTPLAFVFPAEDLSTTLENEAIATGWF